SYFIFKERKQILEYFKKVREGLSDNGLFFMDIFGGTECYDVLEEETDYDDFSYFWDCDYFNPITNEVLYYIHFKDKKDNLKYERVFTYDWRQWSIREIREILEEAGFSKSTLYWEEDDDDGEGNGVFYASEEEENCESWVSYIVAQK
ncbi:MAG: class I SAM-dependent methyltransferase, partial [Bdellovibrionales bacterium]|nr:class I SAM-dependent methyltransferase [Bdellovibrionales bacterium]